MSQDPHLPDWAIPGPAPASVVKAADTRRVQSRMLVNMNQIQPGSITLVELAPGVVTTVGGAVVPYGTLAGMGPTTDKQMYVATNDGDGSTSSALWQYESGAFVRVGPPTKHASQHNAGGADPLAIDAVAATGSLRTLGTGAQQATAGNDTRIPVGAALTADMTAINSLTTMQNLTGLGLSIGASATEVWAVEYWILALAANITMDIKFGFTVPTSCTMRGGPMIGNNAAVSGWAALPVATTAAAIPTQASVITFGTGANVTQGFYMTYVVIGGGTSGTVQIQYAQNTSDPGSLQILKGSSMRASKLAA